MIRRRDQLGVIDKGWWRALYTASFVPPEDPGYLALGPLQLVSQDQIVPGGKFKLHPHENVEVLTLVLDGAFEHADTARHAARATAGAAMMMSAGRGIQHTEAGDADEGARVVTIWLAPRTRDVEPHYALRALEAGPGWRLVAAERGAPLAIDSDVRVHLGRLTPGQRYDFEVAPGRCAYIAPVEGEAAFNGERLASPDRIIAGAGALAIETHTCATVVMIDLPA